MKPASILSAIFLTFALISGPIMAADMPESKIVPFDGSVDNAIDGSTDIVVPKKKQFDIKETFKKHGTSIAVGTAAGLVVGSIGYVQWYRLAKKLRESRAEVERLETIMKDAKETKDYTRWVDVVMKKENDELKAEVTFLQAELEKVRAELDALKIPLSPEEQQQLTQ